jgi:hypothetical protein
LPCNRHQQIRLAMYYLNSKDSTSYLISSHLTLWTFHLPFHTPTLSLTPTSPLLPTLL